MKAIYRKVANAVNALTTIDATALRIPLGVDGVVVNYLLEYAFDKKSIPFRSCMEDAVQISSKTGQTDDQGLLVKLLEGVIQKEPVYGLDMRTKTGSLGEMLHDRVQDINDSLRTGASRIYFRYVVLFDPNKFADIRASEEELTDNERDQLRWFDGPSNNPIQLKNGGWKYPTSDKIAKLRHVPEIKKLI